MAFSFRGLIELAKVTLGRDNRKSLPVQQVTYKGKVGDCVILMPYGMDANLPIDTLITKLSLEGHPESRIGIPWIKSFLELEEGEQAFYHPPTGSLIKYDKDGNVKVDLSESDGKVAIGKSGAELLDLINQTLTKLETAMNKLSTTTVTTSLGPQPLSTAADFALLETDFATIKSTLDTIKGEL